jgi:outer membrane receptor protein involved in Fe transport
MIYQRWIGWLVVGLGMAIAPAFAGDNGDSGSTTELERITVSAEREDTLIKDVVPTEEIQVPGASGSVLDALDNEPGVQMRRSSLAGTESGKLRLRGFDETRLRITKDGVPLNRDGSYGNGPVDWSMLSSENVEQIEIYRGAGPAKFGNTLGGVVNIVTKTPGDDLETVVKSAYGSYDTWDSSVSHAWKVGKVGWVLSAGHFESDGYLRNNTMDRDNFSALLSFDLPAGWRIGGGVDYSNKENGNPVYNHPDSPYYNSNSPDADEKEIGGPGISSRLLNGAMAWGDGTITEDENSAISAFCERQWGAGRLRLDYRRWTQDRTETYYAADTGNKIYERDTEAEDGNWSLQAAAEYTLGGHHVEAGGETRRYGWGAQTVNYIDSTYFNPRYLNYFAFISQGFEGQPDLMGYHALYLQDTWTLMPELSIEAGVRQEWFHADGVDPDAFGFDWPAEVTELSEDHLDPRLAVTCHPWTDGAITARFGITHRYPTSPEYFWWYLNNGTGYFNTDFGSEAARQYELAVVQSIKGMVEITLRGYYYDIDDYITSASVRGVGSVYYNIGEVDIRGLETGISLNLPYGLRASANLTWQKGDKSDDPYDTDNQLSTQLPDLPEIMFNAGLDYTIERLRIRCWLNHVGKRDHFSDSQLETLDAYTLVNMTAAYRLLSMETIKVDLELSAQNLFDEHYEEEAGYPMPGTLVFGGVRLEF